MTPKAALEALELRPLLGQERERVIEAARELALRIQPIEQPELAIRLAIRQLAAHPDGADTLEQLAGAEVLARQSGLELLAVRLKLMWCHRLGCASPAAVPEATVRQAVAEAKKAGTLDTEWRLALAIIDDTNGRTLREEALALLPSPTQDHARLELHLELATVLEAGADSNGAESHLRSALKLAREYEDDPQIARTSRLLGLHLVARGKRTEAIERLREALQIAQGRQDDWSVVTCATLLAAHEVEHANWAEAAAMSDLLLSAGARRGNWFAVVDGHITGSTVSQQAGDLDGAIDRLVRATVRLRALIPAGAINLLKGRLAELRATLGADVFDPIFDRSVQAHTPRTV